MNTSDRPGVVKADPAARRQALLLIVIGTALGASLIAGFEHVREPFHEWLVSEPEQESWRIGLALFVLTAVLIGPAIGIAVYLWLLGAKVLRSRQFPPPGLRVIRDTPIVEGRAAEFRGYAIQVFALCLGMFTILLCLSFWWLVRTFGQGA